MSEYGVGDSDISGTGSIVESLRSNIGHDWLSLGCMLEMNSSETSFAASVKNPNAPGSDIERQRERWGVLIERHDAHCQAFVNEMRKSLGRTRRRR